MSGPQSCIASHELSYVLLYWKLKLSLNLDNEGKLSLIPDQEKMLTDNCLLFVKYAG